MRAIYFLFHNNAFSLDITFRMNVCIFIVLIILNWMGIWPISLDLHSWLNVTSNNYICIWTGCVCGCSGVFMLGVENMSVFEPLMLVFKRQMTYKGNCQLLATDFQRVLNICCYLEQYSPVLEITIKIKKISLLILLPIETDFYRYLSRQTYHDLWGC